jgi:hypothetical protein
MEIGLDTDQMRTFGSKISSARGEEWVAFAHRIDSDDDSPAAALVGNRGNDPNRLLSFLLEMKLKGAILPWVCV